MVRLLVKQPEIIKFDRVRLETKRELQCVIVLSVIYGRTMRKNFRYNVDRRLNIIYGNNMRKKLRNTLICLPKLNLT